MSALFLYYLKGREGKGVIRPGGIGRPVKSVSQIVRVHEYRGSIQLDIFLRGVFCIPRLQIYTTANFYVLPVIIRVSFKTKLLSQFTIVLERRQNTRVRLYRQHHQLYLPPSTTQQVPTFNNKYLNITSTTHQQPLHQPTTPTTPPLVTIVNHNYHHHRLVFRHYIRPPVLLRPEPKIIGWREVTSRSHYPHLSILTLLYSFVAILSGFTFVHLSSYSICLLSPSLS